MKQGREVFFFKNYFLEFYEDLNLDIKKKIDWVIQLLCTIPFVPEQYLQRIQGTDSLYEMRVAFGGRIFRVFCCFDEGNIIILFNGFEKKSSKTPGKEIEKAIRIEREYREAKATGKTANLLRRTS